MIAEPKEQLIALLRAALQSVAPQQSGAPIHLERPKQADHGDFASNLAFQLAGPLKRNPRELAALLIAELPASPLVIRAEVAGAGFINFSLAAEAKQGVVAEVLKRGADFGRGETKGSKLLLEFVSANPTGPLHVGHGRGAAYGASLANLLGFAGFYVTCEYYINDAGRQMDILALSCWLRYLALFDIELPFPANAYQGDYVRSMAAELQGAHQGRFATFSRQQVLQGVPDFPAANRQDDEAQQQREQCLDALIANAKRLLGEDYAWIHAFSLNEQLGDIREDLQAFGVPFDKWFSEKSLFDTSLVERAIQQLEERGHVYCQDGAKWFRSRHFGDEKDRVVQRDNGAYTYFASDIAYHLNKFERGFERVIDVWGADHHGYITRVKGAVAALGLSAEHLEVTLVQFAVLYRNGVKAPMSTRSGEYVTLRSLREDVGNDACRFFYVSRKSDQHLDFDLDLAKHQSSDNPVYYCQYAYARVCSVLQQWGGDERHLLTADLAGLDKERELVLCARLSAFPELIQHAAVERAPHLIAFYLKELAAEFHGWYNAERMLVDDESLRLARLSLAAAVRQVLANGLVLLGVSTPQAM